MVRGRSGTPGYWQRPEATSAAFTADGFFRTGDVGTLDADGFLYIRDRIKDMIVRTGSARAQCRLTCRFSRWWVRCCS